jgi:hypothetical protein
MGSEGFILMGKTLKLELRLKSLRIGDIQIVNPKNL